MGQIINKQTDNISPFAASVYRATRLIPMGKVATYGQIAKYLGINKAARAVGGALHRNPLAPAVPCHRVVQGDGCLGGFASGAKAKKLLLQNEGVTILNKKIDLKKFQAKL